MLRLNDAPWVWIRKLEPTTVIRQFDTAIGVRQVAALLLDKPEYKPGPEVELCPKMLSMMLTVGDFQEAINNDNATEEFYLQNLARAWAESSSARKIEAPEASSIMQCLENWFEASRLHAMRKVDVVVTEVDALCNKMAATIGAVTNAIDLGNPGILEEPVMTQLLNIEQKQEILDHVKFANIISKRIDLYTTSLQGSVAIDDLTAIAEQMKDMRQKARKVITIRTGVLSRPPLFGVRCREVQGGCEKGKGGSARVSPQAFEGLAVRVLVTCAAGCSRVVAACSMHTACSCTVAAVPSHHRAPVAWCATCSFYDSMMNMSCAIVK